MKTAPNRSTDTVPTMKTRIAPEATKPAETRSRRTASAVTSNSGTRINASADIPTKSFFRRIACVVALVVAFLGIVQTAHALNPPTITAPGDTTAPGAVLSTLSPNFAWNSVSGASGYDNPPAREPKCEKTPNFEVELA